MFPIDLFHRQAKATPDCVAVEAGETSVTYADLHASAEAFAAALQDIDPEPGSRVGICCFNHVAHLVAWLGVLAAGKVWVPLYPKNKADEIGRAVEFTGMSIVVVDPEVRDLVSREGVAIVSTSPDGDESSVDCLVARFAGQRPTFHPLPLDATQAIKFTGGSTGVPKGVMQPYRAWNANIATQIVSWNLQLDDRYLAAAPITHGTSTYILPTLGTGGTIVLMDRPRPADVLDQLANNAITTTFVPPTLIYMMMQEKGVESLRFERLRNLVYGSAPMRSEEIERAQRIFGPVIASTYGQTEAPQIATMISATDLLRDDKRSSVGRETFLTRVAVLDGDGNEVPVGKVGEIVIRGDLVMTGYWRQPERTAETIREGWLHTGDLGSFDEEGFLFIKGRSKDVVITGGFNVYPSDVEPVIAEHDAVADCAVFGVPDDKWGEAVHAAVQFKSGHTADPADIIRHVKDRLGSVKAPKSVVIYDQLPRNAYGKLQKQVLVDDFETGRCAKETA